MKTTVFLVAIVAVMILGSSGMVQESYAREFSSATAEDFITDRNAPPYAQDDCHLGWIFIEYFEIVFGNRLYLHNF